MADKMITVELLKAKGACREQLDLFEKLFPAGILPTKELCIQYASDFNLNFAAMKLLSKDNFNLYRNSIAMAGKVYGETIAPAYKTYRDTIEPYLNNYRETRNFNINAEKIYFESIAPALMIYNESIAPARKNYKEFCAITFFEIYEKENSIGCQ